MPKSVEQRNQELYALQEEFIRALRGQPIDDLARVCRQLRKLRRAIARHPEATELRSVSILPADLVQRTNREHVAVWRAIGAALDTLARQ
jgi:hypothetical protein